ncbi:hypothetical protein AURDEDRAFT_129703 [Auricularia subglabra TFB-10046 SS5]|nr:hypothetical protein AURDEDRAFT_129703 [Auricularia subglabra TFB-10046 SS5]
MPPRAPAQPLSQFELWAGARLRALYDARCEDARHSSSRKTSKFGPLLKYYMDQYEEEPFARAMHATNLHPDGRQINTEKELRKKADQYLRNHSIQPLVKLTIFEAQGREAADHPSRAAPAMEIWAATEKDLIRIATHEQLGIPLDTPAVSRPDNYLGVRKQVLRHKFDNLPQQEQEEWRTMAQERKSKIDDGRPVPIVVQDRQESFSTDLADSLEKQIGTGALGKTFVLNFQPKTSLCIASVGNLLLTTQCSGTRPKRARRTVRGILRERSDSDPLPGYVVPRLPKLSGEPSASELNQLRAHLKHYFELLFDFRVDGPESVDFPAFWADVNERPFDYVEITRIPEGSKFANPLTLTDVEFIRLYRHAWASQAKRAEVDEDHRFLFRQSIVDETRSNQRALRLKKRQATRRARESEAASEPPPAYEDSIAADAAAPGAATTTGTAAPGTTANTGTAPGTAAPNTTAPGTTTTTTSAAAPGAAATIGTAAPGTTTTTTAAVAGTAAAPGTVAEAATAPGGTVAAPAAPAAAAVAPATTIPGSAGATPTAAAAASAAAHVASAPAKKRKRRSSIQLATQEEMAEMEDGHNTRNRDTRRPVAGSAVTRKRGRRRG